MDTETDDGSTNVQLFSENEEFLFEDEMDLREVEEANAFVVKASHQRSASLSEPSVKEFVFRLRDVLRILVIMLVLILMLFRMSR